MNPITKIATVAIVANAVMAVLIWSAFADVRVPEACAALAKRAGIPRVLTAEQASQAWASLSQLNDDDPIVRRCREAVIALIAGLK